MDFPMGKIALLKNDIQMVGQRVSKSRIETSTVITESLNLLMQARPIQRKYQILEIPLTSRIPMKIFARLLQGQLMLDVNQFLHIILRINMVIDILYTQTIIRPDLIPDPSRIKSFPRAPNQP
jgi:hypothetical protein